mmetsp:Transcript_18333/g.22528  ORF Transcript_18333/g.22528 Transcript_18333/m.22528 type:complete len:225 (+) Transcript_18333:384-1058(+)
MCGNHGSHCGHHWREALAVQEGRTSRCQQTFPAAPGPSEVHTDTHCNFVLCVAICMAQCPAVRHGLCGLAEGLPSCAPDALLGRLPQTRRTDACAAFRRFLSAEVGWCAEFCAQHHPGIGAGWSQSSRLLQQRKPHHSLGTGELWCYSDTRTWSRGTTEAQDHAAVPSLLVGTAQVQTAYHPILRLHTMRFVSGASFVVVGNSRGDFPSLTNRPLCHLCPGLHR